MLGEPSSLHTAGPGTRTSQIFINTGKNGNGFDKQGFRLLDESSRLDSGCAAQGTAGALSGKGLDRLTS
jgi:hypothetical protein